MSLRWTAYIAGKRPKGRKLKKRKMAVFRPKVHFSREKKSAKSLFM